MAEGNAIYMWRCNVREIKFKGKRVDNGEWVYGYVYHSQIFRQGSSCQDVMIIRDECDEDFEVKENTVGQYTGLKDANDVDIYEGDILDGKFEIVVIFKDGMFCGEQLGVEYYYCPLVEWGLSRNIIGNIHD